MKIAIVGSRGFPSTYGGFETFVREFAPFAAGEGHEVTVYGHGNDEPSSYWVDNVQVINVVGSQSKSAATATHGLNAFLDARRRSFDVALVLNPANGPFLPLLRCPSVVNPDGLEWRREKWGPIAKGAFLSGALAVARWADEIVVDSLAIGRYWRVAFKRDTTFIPYGADVVLDHDADPVRELGLEPGNYALSVARLAPENNVELAVHALARMPSDATLLVVGDANYHSPTVALLRNVQRRDARLKWVGRIDDQQLLGTLWGNAAVHLHGHSVGGTNPALLQGMGHGAGPIAFRSPFNQEVLGCTDRLYRDSYELADLWTNVLDRPIAQERWKQRCQERVAEHYSWRSVCRDYLKVLERAAGGPLALARAESF